MNTKLLQSERFDIEKVKAAIIEANKIYFAEQEKDGRLTSGEIGNRLIINDLTIAEAYEVYDYFYNYGYNYSGILANWDYTQYL